MVFNTANAALDAMDGLQQQRLEKKGCDVILFASNNSQHPVHSSVICSQSPVFEAMLQTSEMIEKEEKIVYTKVKARTLRNLLDAVYCQDLETFGFHQACDLLQVALYYNLKHVIKISVKFLVKCARHRCPEACCMFDYPENIKSALARFQEREYYLNNNLNLSHVCDILFLFLHRSDENERILKMCSAIKESLLTFGKPIVNVLNYQQIKKLLVPLVKEEDWKTQDLRSELPVTSLILFDIYDVLNKADDSMIDCVLQNEIMTRLLNVMDFLNEANVEHIQNLTPYCCKTYDECKHQVQQTQNNHREQIKNSMVLEHMKLQDKEALGLSNEDNFKERTQLNAVNHTYRDSDEFEEIYQEDDIPDFVEDYIQESAESAEEKFEEQ